MSRWDAALLALLMLGHLCNASQPACEGQGQGEAECQRNLYDQVYLGEMYEREIGKREAGLMTNVLLSPALWGDPEAAGPLSVLDAGAGRGIMVDWLRQGRAPRAVEAVGIELSGVAVDSSPWPELKRNGTLVRGSLDAIPWPDRHFDLVWSNEVLEHIPAAQMPAVRKRPPP
jgi:2-polyprenyl-3-methyl-5-hydroxy-6-metoxy-1,4-benzoquinol methylase